MAVAVTDRTNTERGVGGSIAGRLAAARALLARHFLARAYDVATVAFVTVFHRVIGAKFLHAQMSFDEHYFVCEGFSVVKGLVPYRDFQELKPPVIIVLNGLALKLFGLDGFAYRHLFDLLSLAGFLAVTVALLSRGVNRWFVASVVAFMVNHFFDGNYHDLSINNAESAGLDFFMLGCGILLFKTRWQRTQQVLGGAVLSLVPLSKEPLALVTAAAWWRSFSFTTMSTGGGGPGAPSRATRSPAWAPSSSFGSSTCSRRGHCARTSRNSR